MEDRHALDTVKKAETPVVLVLNKVDIVGSKGSILPLIEKYRELHEFVDYVPLSAKTGENVDALRMVRRTVFPARRARRSCAEVARADRVDADRRLVEEDDGRVVQEPARDVQALAHAARVALDALLLAASRPTSSSTSPIRASARGRGTP